MGKTKWSAEFLKIFTFNIIIFIINYFIIIIWYVQKINTKVSPARASSVTGDSILASHGSQVFGAGL